MQVNGKVRDRLTVLADEDPEVVRAKALACLNVQKRIEGKELVKVLVVPNRIVTIVVR